MKKPYCDLHLNANLSDTKQTEELVAKAAELGYRLVATPFPLNCTRDQMNQIRDPCTENGLDFATRVDLKPHTPNELMRNLRKLRRKFEIIAVICNDKNVARQAAKDHRVDLLNFPSIDRRNRFFDMAEAELASKSSASLEIDTEPLLALEGPPRIRLLSCLRKEATVADSFKVPIIISSGTTRPELLRKPQDLAALAQLFDMDEHAALKAVSSDSFALVHRNRQKLSEDFVAPGIRIVRRVKDC
jgi:RNase P/RNase MRP subunit p30